MNKKINLIGVMVLAYGLTICQSGTFTMNQVGSNRILDNPFALVYGPDDYLWVSERERGVLVRIHPEKAIRDEILRIDDVYSDSRQDGLLGFTLHHNFLEGSPYVYFSYTYLKDGIRKQKIVRGTYSGPIDDGELNDFLVLLDQLPASNDHNSGRLVMGPDFKLYYTIGDQGGNQNRNFCNPILSQSLPTQGEIDIQVWKNYPGKILRINLDGTIPDDNPIWGNVRSHIYTIGHRNPQGLSFSKSGILYSDEHGPNTDDEANIIKAGKNYGWPLVVGYQDDQAYDYCNWSAAADCENLTYANGNCPSSVNILEESSFSESNFEEPIYSLFAVTDDYDYNDPACENAWICRPNIAPSSILVYEQEAIPGWENSLLITSLKRGRIFRLKLDESGQSVIGDTIHHFYTQNRYRDITVSPDGRSIFIITDQSGRTSGPSGLTVTSSLKNPGAILKFTYSESVSSSELSFSGQVEVWPNPAGDEFTVEITDSDNVKWAVRVFDLQGNLIKSLPFIRSHIITMSSSDILPGVYLINIVGEKGSMVKKISIF